MTPLEASLELAQKQYIDVDYESILKHPILGNALMESPYAPTPELEKAIKNSIQNIEINKYPRYISDLENKIRQWHDVADHYSVMIGNGGFDLLDQIMRFVALKDGANVLLFKHDFFMFDIMCQRHKIRARYLNQSESVFASNLKSKNLSDSDLILLSSPSNPLGKSRYLDELKLIAEASRGLVVIDETYVNFAKESAIELLEQHKNVVITRSFSKIGFAGIRFGYAIGNKLVIDALKRGRNPFSVNVYSIAVANAIIGNFTQVKTNIDATISERNRLVNQINLMAASVMAENTDTNFVLLKIKEHSPDALYKYLLTEKVASRAYPFQIDGHSVIRIDVKLPKENDRIINVISNYV